MSSKTIGLDINFKLSNFWFWGGREGQERCASIMGSLVFSNYQIIDNTEYISEKI
jgi:hypothetical protein